MTGLERVETAAPRNAYLCSDGKWMVMSGSTQTMAENLAHFQGHEVTVGPVLSVDQLMQDPHVKERGVIMDVQDSELGTIPMHCVFPRLSGTPGTIRTESPRLGEHQALVDGNKSPLS